MKRIEFFFNLETESENLQQNKTLQRAMKIRTFSGFFIPIAAT